MTWILWMLATTVLGQAAGGSFSPTSSTFNIPEPGAIETRVVGTGHTDWELYQCPPGAREMWGSPSGKRYVGFRWVRSDGTTCDLVPSSKINFYETAARDVEVTGSNPPPNPLDLEMASAQYRIRRNFYLETEEDSSGRTREYYYYQDHKEYTGKSEQISVRLQFEARDSNPLYPWEKELLRLTFNGFEMKAQVVSGAYEYRLRTTTEESEGKKSVFVQITPLRKILTPADPQGISGELAATQDGGSFQVVFKDRWASYYAGQEVEIVFEIKRARRYWTDPMIFQGTLRFRAQAERVVDLSAWKPAEPLKKGEEYFLKFSFRRMGRSISTEDWTPEQVGPKVRF